MGGLGSVNLRCWNCQAAYEFGCLQYCRDCGFPLEVIYRLSPATVEPWVDNVRFSGMWRYHPLLPIMNLGSIVTLGEGGTPLLRCERLGTGYGIAHLWAKLEYVSPTGSFKDRPTSVAVSVAKEMGVAAAVASSTGNAGASLAAYAARAGMRSYVFVPEGTPSSKLVQIAGPGATVIVVRGDVSDTFALAKDIAEIFDWVNLTSTFICPYGLEGDKTIAYELFEDLDGRVPEWILVPVSVGPLLVGILKGYKELLQMGKVKSLPRMIAVQALGCAPIVQAYRTKSDVVRPWLEPKTIAGAIADPMRGYAQEATVTLRAIRESDGMAIAVPDKAIVRAMRRAARGEGILLEPAAAAAIAGLEQLVSSGVCKSEETVVAILTGSGLKTKESWESEVQMSQPIDPSVDAFERAFSRRGC